MSCGVNRLSLFPVASTYPELHENQRNELIFFKIIPSHFCSASEVHKLGPTNFTVQSQKKVEVF